MFPSFPVSHSYESIPRGLLFLRFRSFPLTAVRHWHKIPRTDHEVFQPGTKISIWCCRQGNMTGTRLQTHLPRRCRSLLCFRWNSTPFPGLCARPSGKPAFPVFACTGQEFPRRRSPSLPLRNSENEVPPRDYSCEPPRCFDPRCSWLRRRRSSISRCPSSLLSRRTHPPRSEHSS